MKYFITLFTIYIYTNTSLAQKFKLISDDRKFAITSDNSNLRQNCIQSGGKIYYEVADNNLAVIDNIVKNDYRNVFIH